MSHVSVLEGGQTGREYHNLPGDGPQALLRSPSRTRQSTTGAINSKTAINRQVATSAAAHFLTLCAAVDYTNQFETCRPRGLTAAMCSQEKRPHPNNCRPRN